MIMKPTPSRQNNRTNIPQLSILVRLCQLCFSSWIYGM